MSELAFIPDGYTREGYIAANPGFHPAVSFRYRTQAFEHSIRARDHWHHGTPEARGAVPVAYVQKSIVSWDVKDPSGNAVALDFELIRRLSPLLLERMFYIVIGTDKSDLPTGALPSQAEVELDEEAAYKKRLVEELRQENDAKNSSAVSTLS